MTRRQRDVWSPLKQDRSGAIPCPGGLSLYSVSIPEPRLAGLSLFFFSDTHFRTKPVYSIPGGIFGFERIARTLRETLDAYPADVVIFGGDLISESVWLRDAFSMLRSLPAKIAKLAVKGNWDSYAGWISDQTWRDGYAGAGFRFLENESFTLDAVSFYGTADFKTGSPRYRPDPERCNCLVSHNPDSIPFLRHRYGAARLALCGHTHGGQCRIPGYGAVITSSRYGKRFELGSYLCGQDGSRLLVSGGIGTTWLSLRLFCPPEAYRVEFTGETPR